MASGRRTVQAAQFVPGAVGVGEPGRACAGFRAGDGAEAVPPQAGDAGPVGGGAVLRDDGLQAPTLPPEAVDGPRRGVAPAAVPPVPAGPGDRLRGQRRRLAAFRVADHGGGRAVGVAPRPVTVAGDAAVVAVDGPRAGWPAPSTGIRQRPSRTGWPSSALPRRSPADRVLKTGGGRLGPAVPGRLRMGGSQGAAAVPDSVRRFPRTMASPRLSLPDRGSDGYFSGNIADAAMRWSPGPDRRSRRNIPPAPRPARACRGPSGTASSQLPSVRPARMRQGQEPMMSRGFRAVSGRREGKVHQTRITEPHGIQSPEGLVGIAGGPVAARPNNASRHSLTVSKPSRVGSRKSELLVGAPPLRVPGRPGCPACCGERCRQADADSRSRGRSSCRVGAAAIFDPEEDTGAPLLGRPPLVLEHLDKE